MRVGVHCARSKKLNFLIKNQNTTLYSGGWCPRKMSTGSGGGGTRKSTLRYYLIKNNLKKNL